jgi:hypothetical protein
VSNETYAKIYREFTPPLKTFYSVTCYLQNKIIPGTVTSSVFTYLRKNFIFTDYINSYTDSKGTITNFDSINGKGTLFQYEQNPSLITPNFSIVGSIDYINGVIKINQTIFDNIYGSLKLSAAPLAKDIYCKDNVILEIDSISRISLDLVKT